MSKNVKGIEDVQSYADTRQIPIDRVGVKDINHPVRLRDRSNREQHSIANFNMYVGLPHDVKGTHMSRFVEILHHDRELSVKAFPALLDAMIERLDAEGGRIEMSFPYFVMKKAPVSGVESLMDYRVALIGERRGTRTDMWIEELIDIAEEEASCELFGILKRPDEKYVTERAYDNPKFVEDLVRDIAGRLDQDSRVLAYVVESENFESIHNHSAYALIKRDKEVEHDRRQPSGSRHVEVEY